MLGAVDSLTPAQRDTVRRTLDPGERLLWAAGASRGMLAGAVLPAGCGIPFVLMGAWPLIMVLRHIGTIFDDQNGPIGFLFFAGFGLLFVAAGLLTIRHGFTLRRDLAAAVWAVTDRRFFKVVARHNRRVLEAVPLRLVTGVDLVEYGDGSGTLTLTTDAPHTERRKGAGRRRGQYRIMGVKDAAAARRLIQAEVDRAVAAETG